MSKVYRGVCFDDERSLFGESNIEIIDSEFIKGESPLKHIENAKIYNTEFKWKYPIWYSKGISIDRSYFSIDARAGIWYSEDIKIENTKFDAPKSLRRSKLIKIENSRFENAEETLWSSSDIRVTNSYFKGDYLFMNSSDIEAKNIKIDGHYSFDGVRNVLIENAEIHSKDIFWNSENVTVRDSVIDSEYIGWNSRNLRFERCKIASLQGFCYIENLTIKGGDLSGVSLAFEYSDVDVDAESSIISIFNPKSGKIRLSSSDALILEKDKIDADKTKIEIEEIKEVSDDPKEYLRF